MGGRATCVDGEAARISRHHIQARVSSCCCHDGVCVVSPITHADSTHYVLIRTITGHSQTGASNKEAFINRLLCGMVQMGSYPEISGPFDVTPVDWVARAIVTISLESKSLGKAFNLINPQINYLKRPQQPQHPQKPQHSNESEKEEEKEKGKGKKKVKEGQVKVVAIIEGDVEGYKGRVKEVEDEFEKKMEGLKEKLKLRKKELESLFKVLDLGNGFILKEVSTSNDVVVGPIGGDSAKRKGEPLVTLDLVAEFINRSYPLRKVS